MNGAPIAIHGDHAYIGSRTDGGHRGMPQGGVMVVDRGSFYDISGANASNPRLLYQM
jgi:hypothetical protein